jgi:DNA-binding protein HU-beta
MTISELIDQVAASDSKLTKAQAKSIVDAVFAAIGAAAKKGDEVSVPGFGKFKVQSKPARTGRNPSTGATIQIAASKKLGFTAAKAVKDKLNG